MKPNSRSVSKAQRDVWAWKDAIYQEVRHLPVKEALAAILDRAEETRPKAKRRRPQRRRSPRRPSAR